MRSPTGNDVLQVLRGACARVADRASHVRINQPAVVPYAESRAAESPPGPDVDLVAGSVEDRVAFWLTLDAINFGSGWFPTLRKPQGRSGYYTIATGLTKRFVAHGPWTPSELQAISPAEIASTLGQEPQHELMELFARSLRDLGAHVEELNGFAQVAGSDSAADLVARLAEWDCFGDTSRYGSLEVPFLKRAQIAAADLHRAGVAEFADLHRLTMFADNLVPHVLRLDGVLEYQPDLVARIESHDLLTHGSPEEVEIRACALHAVELLVAASPGRTAAELDQQLWLRGQQPRYKAVPRHRCRCTAY